MNFSLRNFLFGLLWLLFFSIAFISLSFIYLTFFSKQKPLILLNFPELILSLPFIISGLFMGLFYSIKFKEKLDYTKLLEITLSFYIWFIPVTLILLYLWFPKIPLYSAFFSPKQLFIFILNFIISYFSLYIGNSLYSSNR